MSARRFAAWAVAQCAAALLVGGAAGGLLDGAGGLVCEAGRFGRPPAVDGDLSEWAAVPPEYLAAGAQLVSFDHWDGPADLSASFRFGWDGQSLYFAAEVSDDAHVQEKSGSAIWQGDSIQLRIDAEHDLAEAMGPDDSEINFGLGPDGPVIWHHRRPGGAEPGPLEGGELAVVPEGGVTRYELAVPWSALGCDPPQDGGRMGLNVIVNDDDGRGRTGILMWTPDDSGGHTDSRLFGDLLLVARAKPRAFGPFGTLSTYDGTFGIGETIYARVTTVSPAELGPCDVVISVIHADTFEPAAQVGGTRPLGSGIDSTVVQVQTDRMQPGRYLLQAAVVGEGGVVPVLATPVKLFDVEAALAEVDSIPVLVRRLSDAAAERAAALSSADPDPAAVNAVLSLLRQKTVAEGLAAGSIGYAPAGPDDPTEARRAFSEAKESLLGVGAGLHRVRVATAAALGEEVPEGEWAWLGRLIGPSIEYDWRSFDWGRGRADYLVLRWAGIPIGSCWMEWFEDEMAARSERDMWVSGRADRGAVVEEPRIGAVDAQVVDDPHFADTVVFPRGERMVWCSTASTDSAARLAGCIIEETPITDEVIAEIRMAAGCGVDLGDVDRLLGFPYAGAMIDNVTGSRLQGELREAAESVCALGGAEPAGGAGGGPYIAFALTSVARDKGIALPDVDSVPALRADDSRVYIIADDEAGLLRASAALIDLVRALRGRAALVCGDMVWQTQGGGADGTPEELVRGAWTGGWDVVGLADLDTVEPALAAAEYAVSEGLGVAVLTGQHIDTPEATLAVYGVGETIPSDGAFDDVVAVAHGAGGVVYYPWPWDSSEAWVRRTAEDWAGTGMDVCGVSRWAKEELLPAWIDEGRVPPCLIPWSGGVVFAQSCTEEAVVDAMRRGLCVGVEDGAAVGPRWLVDVVRMLLGEGEWIRTRYVERIAGRLAAVLAAESGVAVEGASQ